MAKGGIDRLKRKEAYRPLRKRYLIITEGETERNYFLMIKKYKTSNVAIKCTKGSDHCPNDLILVAAALQAAHGSIGENPM